MTTTATSTRSPDLMRLGVTWSGHRSELVLAARVPLGELVPAVAAALGALDPEEVHRGCALVAGDDRVLDPETGLREQGVRDGETLTLVLGLGDGPEADAVVHDDLVDAVTDALAVVSPAWDVDDSRSSSQVLGGLGLAGGALVLGLHHSSGPVVAAAAAGLAALLLVAGTSAARRRTTGTADLLLLAAGPYAAVAGLAAAADVARSLLLAGLALALTGGAALALAASATRSQRPSRSSGPSGSSGSSGSLVDTAGAVTPLAPVVVPWLVGGTFAALVGASLTLTSLSSRQVVAVELVSLVALGGVVPWVVGPRSRPGRRLALAGVLGVDLVLAASAPVVVTGGGWAGLGLVGVCGLLLARRTRTATHDGGGKLFRAVAVAAALAGPVVASLTAMFQTPPLRLPPAFLSTLILDTDPWGAVPVMVSAATMVATTLTAVAAPILTFLRPGRQPASRGLPWGLRTLDHVDLVEGVASALLMLLLVVLLIVSVGLVSRVGVS